MSLLSKTEMATLARNIAEAISIPVIADMEEGYGNHIQVMRSLRELEAAGVAGMHIDDAEIGKCPHLPGIPPARCVSVEEMVARIKACREGRKDPDFIIVVRCNLSGTVPDDQFDTVFPETLERCKEYVRAGADMVFANARKREHMERYMSEIGVPILANFTPWRFKEALTMQDLRAMGVAVVITSATSLFAAAKGMVAMLEALKETGRYEDIQDKVIEAEEFFDLIDLSRYAELYRQFGA